MPNACKQVFSDIKVIYWMGRFSDVVRGLYFIKYPTYPNMRLTISLGWDHFKDGTRFNVPLVVCKCETNAFY